MNELLARHDPASVAIVEGDSGRATTYGELLERVEVTSTRLRSRLGRGLVFHVTSGTTDSIVLYLSCLAARIPVALLDPAQSEHFDGLLETYQPQLLFMPSNIALPRGYRAEPHLVDGASYAAYVDDRLPAARALHEDLALLLTTSGSTGSPKLVRLSLKSVVANAMSIAEYLAIGPGQRSIQSLPLHYSYGLSLVNSHLVAGATTVLTRHSFMRPEFWQVFDDAACTSLAGVPYIYETLHRLRFDPRAHASLRTMTQAGGGLRPDLIATFHERAMAADCRFFVMYGQTEATARIAYVPHERLGEKIGSIGVAIPNGRLSLSAVADSDQHELIYAGPNVMLGYAECRDDLAKGDSMQGRLPTGDLARVDDEGFHYLTGRLKRFAKLFGRRLNLEDLERDLELQFPVQAIVAEQDAALTVYVASASNVDLAEVTLHLARKLNVPPRCVNARAVERIPMTTSGKKDYGALQA